MIWVLTRMPSLHEAMSEDVVFLAFQLWLFGMALMTVSIELSFPSLCSVTHGCNRRS